MFWFIAKFLAKHDKALDARDFDMIGVLGRLTVPIRAGGTGEIVFSQEGSRRCAGARSEDGTAIEKKTEVIVTRYEKGIAYVRRWDEMADELGAGNRELGTGQNK
jgi:membrane protein implicated in regulation of membrane protease activity